MSIITASGLNHLVTTLADAEQAAEKLINAGWGDVLISMADKI